MNINWHDRLSNEKLRVNNFIEGKCVESMGNDLITKQFAGDGRRLYEFRDSTHNEVERAIASAQNAFDDGRWKNLTVFQRKSVLQKLADLIEEHKETLALYECLDVGKPITNALNIDVNQAIAVIRGSAEKADKLLSPSGVDGSNFACQLRKPVGVVAAIIGWNYPLCLAVSKLGPALAMGNSLVLKPSEFTPLSSCLLAKLALEAGVPPGVFNVVQGYGHTVGAALASHQSVLLLSFTGSSATGKQLMVASGQSNMKRLLLECGGKSPYLIFEDCPDDLDFIATEIVETAFHNQGELCVAGTRLLIEASIKNKLLPKIIKKTGEIYPLDPLDPESRFGALINETHLNKALAYIESGEKEGAALIHGGKRVNLDSGGYYLEPTVFDNVSPRQKIAREEIFGPVLSVFTFQDESEAVNMANDTCYGLAAYAATENLGRAQRLGQRLNAGFIKITGTATPAPGYVEIGSAGHRQSGFGFEGGLDGLASYTVSSTINYIV